ncbi:MAG TPA: hypothetical protein VIH95_09740 [Acidimicrobiales bacterium]
MDRSEDSRSRRRTKEEIRELVMDAGRSILVEEGLGVGAGDLTFKRAFERVEATTGERLTNASVIRRVWENQADFQTDVLASVASAGESNGELNSTIEAVAPLFAALDRSSPEARLRSVSDVCRVAGEASFHAMVDSRSWSLWVGVWVLTATSSPTPHSDRLRRALVDGYELDTTRWGEMHGGLAAHLGMRLRAPFTLRQFTVAVGALVEGCVLRQIGADDLALIERPTGPGGTMQPWTLFAVGLEALTRQFFELDPDWVPPDEPIVAGG